MLRDIDDVSAFERAAYTRACTACVSCDGAAIANTIAGLALAIHGQYETTVDLYMRWTPINSVIDAVGEGMEFILWGGGDMARIVELEVRRESIDQGIIVHAA